MFAADTLAPPAPAGLGARVPNPFDRRPAAAADDGSRAPRGHWLAAALDELDYGVVVLIGSSMEVVHMNDAARAQLEDDPSLQLCGRELRPRLARDVAPLHDAVNAAAVRGMRKLVTLGSDADKTSASVIPLEASADGVAAVLIVLGKRAVCESLSIQGYARSCGLTGAETRVLSGLCNGALPTEIASNLGVAVSTVRSQIGSLRQKTGAASIRALVRQIAVLPPVKGVLRAGRSMTARLSLA